MTGASQWRAAELVWVEMELVEEVEVEVSKKMRFLLSSPLSFKLLSLYFLSLSLSYRSILISVLSQGKAARSGGMATSASVRWRAGGG